MPKGHISQHSTLLYQLAFGGVFLFVVLWAARTMLGGSTTNVKMVGAMMAGVAVVLALDKHYWIILPILKTSGFDIPGLPFSALEIGQIMVIVMYFVRKGLSGTEEQPVKINSDLLIALPLMLWVFGMYCYNPCGMQITGSMKLGGRWYLQILFAFLSFMVMSTWRIGEKESKMFFWLVLGSCLFSLSRTFLSGGFSFGRRVFTANSGTFYEFIGFISIYVLMFARFTLWELVSNFRRLAIVMISGALVAYSGKRMMFGWVVFTPYIRLLLTGRDKWLTLVCSIIGSVVVFCVIAGDFAGFYDLPKSARRAFATISPKMREEYGYEGVGDRFRELVHAEAIREIRASPWFGLKGFAIDRTDLLLATNRSIISSDRYDAMHGTGRSWHGAFHAYAADFGIPCLACFLFFITIASFKVIKFCRRHANASSRYSSAALLYISIMFCLQLLTLRTSGHSAITTQAFFYQFGMFLAIRNGILAAKEKHALATTGNGGMV